MITLPDATKPIVRFTLHVCVGAIAFILTFGVALAIAGVIHMAEAHRLGPPWLILIAGYVEMALWGLDLFVFGLFLLLETYKYVRSMLE